MRSHRAAHAPCRPDLTNGEIMRKSKAKAPAPVVAKPIPRRADEVHEWIAGFRKPIDAAYPSPEKLLAYLVESWSNPRTWEQWRSNLQQWQDSKDHLSISHRHASRNGKLDHDGIRIATDHERMSHSEFWRFNWEIGELYSLLRRLRPDLIAEFGTPVSLDETFTSNERASNTNRVLAKLLTPSTSGTSSIETKSIPPKSRIEFDKETLSITLDGKTHVLDAVSYSAVSLLHSRIGKVTSRTEIKISVRTLKGKNAITDLFKKLPKPIMECIKSRTGTGGGYEFSLPLIKKK